MNFTRTTAVRGLSPLRMAIDGPPGSGKSWTGLELMTWMSRAFGWKIGTIDTEHRSLEKYAPGGELVPGGHPGFAFEIIEEPMDDYGPDRYVERIKWWESQPDIGGLLIDSLSHAWMGSGGALDMVDKNTKGGNSFNAWKNVTPAHNRLVEALLGTRLHLICTLRSKIEYIQEENPDKPGKNRIVKLGTKPIQREGLAYEFDVTGDMFTDNNELVIDKTRCSALKGQSFVRPGRELADILIKWVSAGKAQIQESPEDKKVRVAAFELLLKRFTSEKEAEVATKEALQSIGKPDSSFGDLDRHNATSVYRYVQRLLSPPPPQQEQPKKEPIPPPKAFTEPGVAKIGDFNQQEIAAIMEQSGAKNRAQVTAWLQQKALPKAGILSALEALPE